MTPEERAERLGWLRAWVANYDVRSDNPCHASIAFLLDALDVCEAERDALRAAYEPATANDVGAVKGGFAVSLRDGVPLYRKVIVRDWFSEEPAATEESNE